AQRTARAIAISEALEISDVAFEVVVAPQTCAEADASLIDNLQVALLEHVRRNERPVRTLEHRSLAVDQTVVQEGIASEQSDLAPLEQVVESNSGLAERSTRLVPAERHMLEAGKESGLEAADAIHKTDIDLSFLLSLEVEKFALDL